MKDKHPKVDPKKTYVMKHRDRVSFVHQLTPMLDGPGLGNAHRFEGQWLNDTCWRWSIYYIPIELDEAFKLYSKIKRVTRNRPVTTAEHQRYQKVRRQVQREFKPKSKTHDKRTSKSSAQRRTTR